MNLEEFFKFFKSSRSYFESISKALIIKNQENQIKGYLISVTNLDLNNDNSINLLTQWRNSNSFAFPLKSSVTNESTKNWLNEQVLNNEKRLLFWIIDINGDKIGHIGLIIDEDKSILIDNVIRGIKFTSKGIMSLSILTLENFLENEFNIFDIYLKVLGSNKNAIDFYKKLNYFAIQEVPLKTEIQTNLIRLVPGTPPDDYFIVMKKNLLKSRSADQKILTAGPLISPLEISFVLDASLNGWNNLHSEYIKKFELEFCRKLEVKYAIATSSCTGALHLALLALGIGPGDEVIVPEITWVATASAVRYVGATPVFADVDSNTWTISEESIMQLINENTKAIIPVHLYGYPANMLKIMEIAKIHNLSVIEDAAPAIGATYNNQFVGSFGDFGCFSFQGAKMLVTGEGGMLVTNNEELYLKALKIQDHGRKPGTFWIEQIGNKYKMSNIQAAFGLGQFRRVDNHIAKKVQINTWYREELYNLNFIKFQNQFLNSKSICWMTSIEFSSETNISRDEIIKQLKKYDIDSRPVFPAISQYPIWDRHQKVKLNAERIGKNSINLPSGAMLSRNSISKICDVLRNIIKE